MPAKKPTFVDAFAGCGGLSLGLKRAGWQGVFAIEKDGFAFETLETNFPHGSAFSYDWPSTIERRAWDIKELVTDRREELMALRGSIDLLAGGPTLSGLLSRWTTQS